MIDKKDRELGIKADQALVHMQDQARLIRQRGPAVTEAAKPFKERRLRNHFMDEARELYGG